MAMFGKAKEQIEMAKQAMAIQKMIKSTTVSGEYGAINLKLGVSLERSGQSMDVSIKVLELNVNKDNLDNIDTDIKNAIEKGSKELIRKLMAELQNSDISLPGM